MTKTSSVANYYIQTLETFANIFYNYLRLQYFRFELFFCHPTNNELTRHSFCLLVHYPIIVDNQQVLFPFLTFFLAFQNKARLVLYIVPWTTNLIKAHGKHSLKFHLAYRRWLIVNVLKGDYIVNEREVLIYVVSIAIARKHNTVEGIGHVLGLDIAWWFLMEICNVLICMYRM